MIPDLILTPLFLAFVLLTVWAVFRRGAP